MVRIEAVAEHEGVAVVFVGNFNPAIIQPSWLAAKGLISESAADAAEVRVIHKEFTDFTVAGTQVLVSGDRFTLASQDAQQRLVRDLGIGIFEILEHTPLHSMGINRTMHFRVNSEDQWHGFGDFLVPKTVWKEAGLKKPGLITLTVMAPREDLGPKGRVDVQVEPSRKVNPGIFINVNNHFEFEESGTRRVLLDGLKNSYENLQTQSREIADFLLNREVEGRAKDF